jgi:hypothetical protein
LYMNIIYIYIYAIYIYTYYVTISSRRPIRRSICLRKYIFAPISVRIYSISRSIMPRNGIFLLYMGAIMPLLSYSSEGNMHKSHQASEVKAMRAELEVQRTGEMLQKERTPWIVYGRRRGGWSP